MSATVRKYAIPTLSALSVSMTAGCADPLVGEWAGVEFSYGGTTYELPYSYEYDGTTYTTQFELYVDSEFTGEFSTVYTYGAETYEYAYSVTAEETGNKQYDIDITDLDLTMACAIDDDKNLACDLEGQGSTIVFEKQ